MKMKPAVNKKYTVTTLTPLDWRSFEHLMFPSLAKQLEKGWDPEKVWMVGIKAFEIPIALTVLEMNKFEKTAMFRSIYVLKEHRRNGLASLLLRHIYTFCQSHGITNVQASYYAKQGTAPPIEEWLIQNGFTTPRMEAKVYHINRQIALAPWKEIGRLPKGFRLVPWIEMDDSLRGKLLIELKHMCPSFLPPYDKNAPVEPLNSLALLSASSIDGWCMSYRLREDVILYDGLYVDPIYQHDDLPIMLLAEAIRIHLNLIDLIPFGLFAVNRTTPGMLTIARQWIEPYAIKVIEKRSCHLSIQHVYEKVQTH